MIDQFKDTETRDLYKQIEDLIHQKYEWIHKYNDLMFELQKARFDNQLLQMRINILEIKNS